MADRPPSPLMALVRQLFAYALIGGFTTALYWGLWAALTWAGLDYRISAGIGYFVGSLVNFGLQKRVTFGDGGSRGLTGKLVVYWVVQLSTLALNVGMVAVLHERFGAPEWLAVIVATAVVLVANFVGHKWLTFNPAIWGVDEPAT